MKKIYLLLITIGLFQIASSQDLPESPCGHNSSFIPVDYKHNVEFAKYASHFSLKNMAATPDTVYIMLHLIRKNNGTGQNATLAELDSELVVMNEYFINANIVFKYCSEVEYIDSTIYYGYNYETETETLFGNHNNPHAVNVYFTDTVIFQGGTVGGLGSGIGYMYEGIIMDYSTVGSKTTYTHEMGHVFHLRHTHGKYNFSINDCDDDEWDDLVIPDEVWCMGAYRFDNHMEIDYNSDGIPDCLQTGDDICDTPSEPNLMVDSLTSGCTYVGHTRDYYGDLFQPLVGNIMSYGPCKDHMSAGQFAKIRYAFETYGLHLQCGGCANYTVKNVTTHDDTGVGSLRWAMECANWNDSTTTLNFNIPEKASSIILLNSRLPLVKKSMIIDGTTQPSGDIIIDGSQLSSDTDYGLYIYSDSVKINGLTFKNFPSYGIVNYYGYNHFTLTNSTIDSCGYLGLYLRQSEHSVIHNNQIANNNDLGIYLSENNNVRITGNIVSNNEQTGIYLGNRNSNITIGDAGSTNANIITGNLYYGIAVRDSSFDIDIFNNYIGTDPNNTTDTGNAYYGIVLNYCSNITIGGNNLGNVLSGNGYFGIGIYDSTHHVNIIGNWIGTDKTGNTPIPNVYDGIRVDSAYDITIGGDNTSEENVIAYNYRAIQIRDNANNCLIRQNSIFCNTYGIYITENANGNVQPPDITDIPGNYTVQGTGLPNSIIRIYRSSPDCEICEGEVFLGMGPGGTTWQVNTTGAINNGDKITAMASVDNNSSVFSTCFTASGLPDVGTEDLLADHIKVFPNPAKSGTSLRIELPGNTITLSVEIINTIGQALYSERIPANLFEIIIELPDFSPGIYLIKVNGADKLWVSPLLISP